MTHKAKAAAIALAIVPITLGAAASAAGATSASSAHSTRSKTFSARLAPVPHNRVSGRGFATVRLDGRTAHITVHVKGLLPDAAHAMHIHAGGEGECPEPNDATLHNGHLAMSTTDGAKDYGPVVTSLTTHGDTSPASLLALDRYPHTGTFTYTRTIRLSRDAARAVRDDNAVLVVHGIDYNHNGRYDNVLGPSDLTPTLPMEATSPALCGPLSPGR
jgi:Cu/Zn superoxide dismutase